MVDSFPARQCTPPTVWYVGEHTTDTYDERQSSGERNPKIHFLKTGLTFFYLYLMPCHKWTIFALQVYNCAKTNSEVVWRWTLWKDLKNEEALNNQIYFMMFSISVWIACCICQACDSLCEDRAGEGRWWNQPACRLNCSLLPRARTFVLWGALYVFLLGILALTFSLRQHHNVALHVLPCLELEPFLLRNPHPIMLLSSDISLPISI